MDWLERHFALFPEPGLTLVIGAGQGRDLPALARHAGARLVLVEPQPNWAVFLRRQTVVSPRAEVLEYALDEQSGSATLKVFNFPELSSLRPDAALASLLPGAQQTAELEVETRTLADLTGELDVQPDGDNWLIIDAPGVEASLLAELSDEELARHYDHIVLRTSRQVCVGEVAGLEALLEAFLERGYRQLGAEDVSDGDWPRVHLQRLGRSAREKKLETELETLKQRSGELATEKGELQEQLKKQTKESGDRMSQLKEQLQQAEREAEQRLAAVTADLEQSRRLHERKVGELEEALKAKTEALEQAKQQQQIRIGEIEAALKAKTEALEQDKLQQQTRIGELESSLEAKSEALSRAGEAHQKKREALQKDLAQLRSDLSVALRVQALRDADLKELQKRYAKLEDLKNQQHELLTKLGQRLGAASEFLQRLGPGGDPEAALGRTDEFVRALGGESDTSSG